MAEDQKRVTFPVIPNAHWWTLRRKFKQTIPGVVSDTYVATVLNMQVNSARANVLPALKATKLIDADGKPGDRAKRWRDDEQYRAVCEEILADVYPSDLLDTIPNPTSDKATAERWFAHHTGAGEAAVAKMVSFYALLSDADPAKGQDTGDAAKKRPRSEVAGTSRRSSRHAASRAVREKPAAERGGSSRQGESTGQAGEGPAVHINLQVHISADASTEQIDQVFASMAKHIYKKATANG